MKIEIKTERDCCQIQDLRPIEGSPLANRYGELTVRKEGEESTDRPRFAFCVHCGRHHRFAAIGDSGLTTYHRVQAPWESVVTRVETTDGTGLWELGETQLPHPFVPANPYDVTSASRYPHCDKCGHEESHSIHDISKYPARWKDEHSGND